MRASLGGGERGSERERLRMGIGALGLQEETDLGLRPLQVRWASLCAAVVLSLSLLFYFHFPFIEIREMVA